MTISAGDLARFIKRLLRGVAAVAVERGPTERVIQPCGCAWGQPDPFASVDAVLPDKRLRVDAPALAIQYIGIRTGEVARKDVRADHGCPRVIVVIKLSLSIRTPPMVVLVTGRNEFTTAGQGRRASAAHRAPRALTRWYN
jgi:hypothetical protein